MAGAARMARSYGRRIGADPDDAEQDLWVAYYRSERVRRHVHTSATYAYKVVRLAVWAGHQQRQPAGRRVHHGWVDATDLPLVDDVLPVRGWVDPTGDVATARADLDWALGRMHPNRRFVLLARAADLGSVEIGRRVGLPKSSVQSIEEGRGTGASGRGAAALAEAAP